MSSIYRLIVSWYREWCCRREFARKVFAVTSIYLVRRGEKWLHVRNRVPQWDDIERATVYHRLSLAKLVADIIQGEPVEFREERGHERAYNHAIDCVDRVFQSGGQPEPPLLPDFCQLGEDKFLAVIRLAKEYLTQRQALAVAQDEITKLKRKLKAAEK